MEWTIASPDSRSQLCTGALHTVPRQPTAVPPQAFPFWHSLMFTCFWACLVELSPCNRSRKKGTRKAGTACCRTPRQHRAGALHHTRSPCSCPCPCLLVCNQKQHRGGQVPVCRETSRKPEDLDTSSLHLCGHMKGHFIPNTLCYQAQTPSAHSTSTRVGDSLLTHHSLPV